MACNSLLFLWDCSESECNQIICQLNLLAEVNFQDNIPGIVTIYKASKTSLNRFMYYLIPIRFSFQLCIFLQIDFRVCNHFGGHKGYNCQTRLWVEFLSTWDNQRGNCNSVVIPTDTITAHNIFFQVIFVMEIPNIISYIEIYVPMKWHRIYIKWFGLYL